MKYLEIHSDMTTWLPPQMERETIYTLISSDEESDAMDKVMDLFDHHTDTTDLNYDDGKTSNGNGQADNIKEQSNDGTEHNYDDGAAANGMSQADNLKEQSNDGTFCLDELNDFRFEAMDEATQSEIANLDEFECAFRSIDEAEQTELLVQVRVHAKFCIRCGTGFVQQKSLNAHLARDECTEKKYTGEMPLTCSICGQGFVQQFCLRQHTMRHAQTKPFKCKVCNKSFVTVRNLYRHYQIHKDYRPHACELCPIKYFSIRNLAKHKRLHAGKRPFFCKICPKRFNKSKRLLIHRQEHSIRKPFKCKFCKRNYRESSMRNLHMRTHTRSRSGKWNFLCEVCGLTHIRTKSLWLNDMKKHDDMMASLRKALVDEIEKSGKDRPARRASSVSVEIIEDPLQIVIDLAED